MRSSLFVRSVASLLPIVSSISATQIGVEADIASTFDPRCERDDGCTVLAVTFPTKVFAPDTTVYEYENQNFWSATEYLSPSCVFRPTSAEDIATAIPILSASDTQFAVRGGGHMAIKGSNNIDNGVLMVMSNLTTLQVSDDLATLDLGPSHRWQDVYDYLEPYELAVAGGRLGPVGVPGLLLAGGINFHGNQHGFAADNVISYEVVLADGSIVTASLTENADLFWALKGGSSNFGIVTRFTIKTFPSPQVWAGSYTVAEEYITQFLAAIADYASNITDPLSHIVPALVPSSSGTLGSVILFYDSPNVSFPECFKSFTDIPAISSTLSFRSLANYSAETGALVTDGINDLFVAGTIIGKTRAEILNGVQIVNQTFFDALPDLYAVLPAENISIIEIDWQPIGDLWLSAGTANNRSGNALGLDASKGTYLCWAEVVEWVGSDYDEVVYKWLQNTTDAINNATKAAGLFDPYNYMGDSAGFQSIYPGYGSINEEKLLNISRAYDPERLFQYLMPGGFKIGA